MKTAIDRISGPYSEYCGHQYSVGRVLHYLSKICGLNLAETVTVGENQVWRYGKEVDSNLLANYTVERGYPYFTFVGENAAYYQLKQKRLLSDWLVNQIIDADGVFINAFPAKDIFFRNGNREFLSITKQEHSIEYMFDIETFAQAIVMENKISNITDVHGDKHVITLFSFVPNKIRQ